MQGIPEPIRAYRVGPPGPQPMVSVASFDELAPSVAVVPFASRSAATDQGVIGEIMAEEVIRRLSQSAYLKVVSRLSTTAFAGRTASLEEIGAHLGADYVLSGSYRAADAAAEARRRAGRDQDRAHPLGRKPRRQSLRLSSAASRNSSAA